MISVLICDCSHFVHFGKKKSVKIRHISFSHKTECGERQWTRSWEGENEFREAEDVMWCQDYPFNVPFFRPWHSREVGNNIHNLAAISHCYWQTLQLFFVTFYCDASHICNGTTINSHASKWLACQRKNKNAMAHVHTQPHSHPFTNTKWWRSLHAKLIRIMRKKKTESLPPHAKYIGYGARTILLESKLVQHFHKFVDTLHESRYLDSRKAEKLTSTTAKSKVKRQRTVAKKRTLEKRRRESENMAEREYEVSLLWPFISGKECCISTKAPFKRYIQIESKAFEGKNKSQQHTRTTQMEKFI